MDGVKYKLLVGLMFFVTTSAAVFEEDLSETSGLATWKQVRKKRVKCPAGQYITCAPCPVNKYKPRIGRQGRCADCKERKGTLGTGSGSCIKLCKAGQRYNESGSCEDCQMGTFMDVRSLNSTCKPCPERMTTDGTGAHSLDKCICLRGYQPTLNGRDCESCPDGTYKAKDGNFACTTCLGSTKISTLTDGAVSKENCTRLCDKGQQLNITTGKCEPCEKNFYKALAGSRERCKPCEPNTVAKSKGSTTCVVECGPGFEYDYSTELCKQCPWGKYKRKVGNDAPCVPCANNTGSARITLVRGAKERATECVRKSSCFAQSLQDLEDYYAIVQSKKFAENENIVSALNSTCFNDDKFTVYKVMQHFLNCPDLRDIILPEVKLGKRRYGHDTQMKLLLGIEKYMIANPGKTYCDYLKCVNPYLDETAKCKCMMPKEGNASHFCSEAWRVGASCVTLKLHNCPALQFHPNVTEDLSLNGLKISEIVAVGNMINLCDSPSEPTTSTTPDTLLTSSPSTITGTLSTSTPSTITGTLSTSTPSTITASISASSTHTSPGTALSSASSTHTTSAHLSQRLTEAPALECWDHVDSRNYAGTLSLTNSGKTCQVWSSNHPHSHENNRDELFPKDGSVAAARNYCRDPDGEGHPWCYTTDPATRWQFCDVSVFPTQREEKLNTISSSMETKTKPHIKGRETSNSLAGGMDCWPDPKLYDGKRVVTKNGRLCQEWSKQTPHEHSNNKAGLFPLDGSVDAAENYCRDPDGEGKPWCYTTDAQVRWEFCDIQICIANCWPNSKVYDGTKAVTNSGRHCQEWAKQTPHEHSNNKAELFPLDESVDAAENYCRDPDGEGKPWCYTIDVQLRWEFCDIPICNVDCWTASALYHGRSAVTINGRQCQEWAKQTPHEHGNNKAELFPLDGSVDAAENYCRDPDGEGKPWCYTTDALVRWEFCDIPTC